MSDCTDGHPIETCSEEAKIALTSTGDALAAGQKESKVRPAGGDRAERLQESIALSLLKFIYRINENIGKFSSLCFLPREDQERSLRSKRGPPSSAEPPFAPRGYLALNA